jgi:hypothetical protein
MQGEATVNAHPHTGASGPLPSSALSRAVLARGAYPMRMPRACHPHFPSVYPSCFPYNCQPISTPPPTTVPNRGFATAQYCFLVTASCQSLGWFARLADLMVRSFGRPGWSAGFLVKSRECTGALCGGGYVTLHRTCLVAKGFNCRDLQHSRSSAGTFEWTIISLRSVVHMSF